MLTLARTVNPLTYPGYRLPGFDPTHPAAQGVVRFSGIATVGGNFINLLNGSSGITELNVTGAIDGTIGPSRVDSVGAPKGGVNFPGTTINDTVVTLAGIVRFSDVSDFAGIFTTTGSAAGGFILASNSGTLGVWQYSAGNFTSSGFTAVVGVPYFYAASLNGTVRANFVLTRLDTGQIFSSTTTSSIGAAGTPSAGFNVGNTAPVNGSQSVIGSVSCAMFSAGNFLSLPQLIAWAADPWSFWYPPDVEQLIFDSLVAQVAAPVGLPLMGQIWM